MNASALQGELKFEPMARVPLPKTHTGTFRQPGLQRQPDLYRQPGLQRLPDLRGQPDLYRQPGLHSHVGNDQVRPPIDFVDEMWRKRIHNFEQTIKLSASFLYEIIHGNRPLDQLGRWVTAELFQKLRVRRSLAQRHRTLINNQRSLQVFDIGRLFYSCPSLSRLEATVLVHKRERTRAIVLSFQTFHARWRIDEAAIL